jgi:hypothetical protein
MFEALIDAHVIFVKISVRVIPPFSKPITGSEATTMEIVCQESNRQLPHVALVCSSFSPSLSTVEHLYISDGGDAPQNWQDKVVV